MHDIPRSDRPRERLLTNGAGALSTVELLAIILQTGSANENVLHLAERILARFNGLQGLAQVSPAELHHFKGLGKAKIAQIAAALELGRRLIQAEVVERPRVTNAAEAVRLVLDMQHLTQEHIRIILLDSSRRVMDIPTVYIGTLNASILRVSEIYREAIVRNSPGIILVHNHPSGDPTPSPEDIELTRTLIAAGNLLDILLLDHIIIGQSSWVSLKELGLAF